MLLISNNLIHKCGHSYFKGIICECKMSCNDRFWAKPLHMQDSFPGNAFLPTFDSFVHTGSKECARSLQLQLLHSKSAQ